MAPTRVPTASPSNPPTLAPTYSPTVATVSHDRVALDNSFPAVAYDTAGCSGQSISISSLNTNILCGTHWKSSGGKGTCVKGTTCANDKVRSIMLPSMTTAKLFKHCNNDFGTSKNTRYQSISNFDSTAKCFDLPNHADKTLGTWDTSNIVIEGDVVKVDANVVGTQADCAESQCESWTSACKKDSACLKLLTTCEKDVATGAKTLVGAMKVHFAKPNEAFKNLYTCLGLMASGCDPVSIGVTPDGGSKYDASLGSSSPSANALDQASNSTGVSSTRLINPAKPVRSMADYNSLGGSFAWPSTFERRRLSAAGATSTAYIQISTNGNQHAIGAASSSAASAQFANAGTGGSSSSAASAVSSKSAQGLSSSATVGIAVGCTAIAALAVALVVHVRQQAASKQPLSKKLETKASQRSLDNPMSNEAHTDVL
jgi:hypothetical protein